VAHPADIIVRSTPGRPWASAPRHPRLAEDAVHVWRADLDAVGEHLLVLLSPEEHARAARLLSERKRQLWARAHSVLRELLGRTLERDPHTLRFVTNPHGKPALRDDPSGSSSSAADAAERTPAGPRRLHFNMSHSGGLALYALSTAGEVGVDVEVAGRPLDVLAVAARAFGPAEARRLQQLDPLTREQELLLAWVRHEAELKCRGTGIIGGAGAEGADGAEGTMGEKVEMEEKVWIAELDMGSHAAAAVAVERPPGELCCWEWPPLPDSGRRGREGGRPGSPARES
jgi:4'-phosphopantetheinyl transferase